MKKLKKKCILKINKNKKNMKANLNIIQAKKLKRNKKVNIKLKFLQKK